LLSSVETRFIWNFIVGTLAFLSEPKRAEAKRICSFWFGWVINGLLFLRWGLQEPKEAGGRDKHRAKGADDNPEGHRESKCVDPGTPEGVKNQRDKEGRHPGQDRSTEALVDRLINDLFVDQYIFTADFTHSVEQNDRIV
jgi:hypothetical protein